MHLDGYVTKLTAVTVQLKSTTLLILFSLVCFLLSFKLYFIVGQNHITAETKLDTLERHEEEDKPWNFKENNVVLGEILVKD